MNNEVYDSNIGHSTAYAYAKASGDLPEGMTPEEYGELLASYATVGQTAVTAAQTATTKASEAATSATTATNKATEATTAATTATNKAAEAQADADAAALDASQAMSAASTATTKATEATTAAATATSAATTATTAKDDAVSAKTAAQTAQTGAETAAASVSASAAQIATNTEDITQLKSELTDLIDPTLSTAGKAADAKKVGDEFASASDDITALQSGKANVDGYYADLVSGGSTQLLSDMVETDTTPYNYRTAGGSLEIGDREKLKKIVGVSATANQLVQNGNFANTDNWSATNATGFSVSDGVASFTPTALYGNIHQFLSGKPLKANHVILCIGDMKADGALENCQLAISDNINFTRAKTVTLGTAWQTVFLMIKETTVAYSNNHTVTFRTFLTSDFAKMYAKNAMIIDLTQFFGSATIADYVYSLETATAGAGVSWLKAHFPKIFDAGYIPYNAGTLEHVSGLSAHKMTGFNQWDEEVELGLIDTTTGANTVSSSNLRSKNFIPVLPSTAYYFKATVGMAVNGAYYDADKGFISSLGNVANGTFTTPSNAHYMRFYLASAYGNIYNHDICINLHWDGERDGEYEPYEEHSYPLDSDVTLRGIPKLDANNNLYYDGDEYEADGTVNRRYGIVDLGTLVWVRRISSATGIYYFYVHAPGIKLDTQLICSKYMQTLYAPNNTNMPDKSIYNRQYFAFADNVIVRDDAYTDETSFKTAMSGVMLVYELATPTTEEADPYTEIQNVSNWGTEEFVTTSLVPVGHETEYQPDLRAKIEVAPESPDTDGLYLMKRENGQNSYVAYLGELPSDPSEDGTYTLKCTVASGTATKTWEADT